MTKKLLTLALAILTVLPSFAAGEEVQEVSGIYAGGHIRRGRPGTYQKLRDSGFTYIILFNVNVEPDGTLTTDGETICKDGKYVFDETNPYYAADVKSLKQAPTSITRIEICIGGWGNTSYGNIKKLIGSASSIPSTHILYKNFKALKEAVPDIDAVNNDQEQDYEVAPAVKFHVMMHKLGYKTSIAPYTYKSFWSDFVTQLNNERKGACDRVMVQCYDGGAGNNPKDWHLNNLPLHAGLLDYSNDWSVDRNLAQMQQWHDNCNVGGGFVWLFNDGYDENWDMQGWATGMNRIFRTAPAEKDIAAIVYSSTKYTGYAIPLTTGRYDRGRLQAHGLKGNDAESVKITEGYVVRFFKANTPTGSTSQKKTADAISLSTYANAINSIIVYTVQDEANADSLKTANTSLNNAWKDAKATIAADYADMLDDEAFKAAYDKLDAEIPALYKAINALDYYDRAMQFATLSAQIAAYAKQIQDLLTWATPVENVMAAKPLPQVIYNLAGQRISTSQKGIRIVNGKKVLY